MNERVRDLLGEVWRLCEQMAYTAENGYVATLNVQFETLSCALTLLAVINRITSIERIFFITVSLFSLLIFIVSSQN